MSSGAVGCSEASCTGYLELSRQEGTPHHLLPNSRFTSYGLPPLPKDGSGKFHGSMFASLLFTQRINTCTLCRKAGAFPSSLPQTRAWTRASGLQEANQTKMFPALVTWRNPIEPRAVIKFFGPGLEQADRR